MRNRRIATAVAAGLTAVPVTVAVSAAAPDEALAGAGHDRVERAVVRQVNAVRRSHGLRRVRSSRSLARSASRHTRWQLARNVITHGNVKRRVGRRHVGETIAWMAGRRARARVVVRMWMRSPAHRAQLLSSRFRRIGVGQRFGALGSQHGTLFTATFASRR